MKVTLSSDFVRAIPKTDLHVHLDGSLRLATLIEPALDREWNAPEESELP